MNAGEQSCARPVGAGLSPPPADALRDIADEIEDHLAHAAARHESAGAAPGAARDRAIRDFGDPKRIAAELSLIAQGDIRMNQRLLYALVTGLTLALAATAFFGYRSTALMTDQVRMMQEQLVTLAAARNNDAPPAPYGTIHVTAKRGNRPVAGAVFDVQGLGSIAEFLKGFATGEDGVMSTGLVPLGRYEVRLKTPTSSPDLAGWTWKWKVEVRVNQPGEDVACELELPPTLGPASFRVLPPGGCTLEADAFLRARVTLKHDNGMTIRAETKLDEPMLVPALPAGSCALSAVYFFNSQVHARGRMLGTKGPNITFPVTDERFDLRPVPSQEIFSGRVFSKEPSNPVPGVRIIKDRHGLMVVAHSDDTGYFGLPPQGRGEEALLEYEHDGRVYALPLHIASLEPAQIDLDKFVKLYVRPEMLPARAGPDLLVSTVSLRIKMARQVDTPLWLSGRSGQFEIAATLSPGDTPDLQPAGILLPADHHSVSATLEIHLEDISGDRNGTGFFSLDVDENLTLLAGETGEFVITREMFDQILASRAPARGGSLFRQRLSEWRAEQKDAN